MKPSISVFFRYDDFCATSDESVDRGLIETFRKHGLRCTIAVIPKVTEGNYRDPSPRGTLELDHSKQVLLAEAVKDGAVDPTLHGWIHRNNGLGMPHSEFRGLACPEQSERIRRGKEALENVVRRPVLTFVPPWNTYDDCTLKALRENGIQCLSANRYGPASKSAGSMRFLPITIELMELESAVESARSSGDDGPIVGVLMHPYDFFESGDPRAKVDLEILHIKLTWLKRQPDVAVSCVSDIAMSNSTLELTRYLSNRPLTLEQLVPPFIRSVSDTPYFATTKTATAARRKRLSGALGVHSLAALAGTITGVVLVRGLDFVFPAAQNAAPWLLTLPLLWLVWRAHAKGGLYFRGMLLTSALAGCLVGTLIGATGGYT